MPDFRLIGYYDDTGQVYDGDWDGDNEVEAVARCRAMSEPYGCETLVLVAILDEQGNNVYDPETASYIMDWPEDEVSNAND
jgi:hypothetical protein